MPAVADEIAKTGGFCWQDKGEATRVATALRDQVRAASGTASAECGSLARVGTLCNVTGVLKGERFAALISPARDGEKVLAGQVNITGGVGVHADLLPGDLPKRSSPSPLP